MSSTRSNSRDQPDRKTRSKAPADTKATVPSSGNDIKEKGETHTDQWVEPPLAPPKPSWADHGGAPYGVLEYIQPLGQPPSAKVKARVKEPPRKAAVAKSVAAERRESVDTPDGTPAPTAVPNMANKKKTVPPAKAVSTTPKEQTPAQGGRRTRAAQAQTVKLKTTAGAPKTAVYDEIKLKRVVESAKSRAIAQNKPDLAAAVNQIYEESKSNPRLRFLLEGILIETATTEEIKEFQSFVREVKKKLRKAARKAAQKAAKQAPEITVNGTHVEAHSQASNATTTQASSEPPTPTPTEAVQETSAATSPVVIPEPTRLRITVPNRQWRRKQIRGSAYMGPTEPDSPEKRPGTAASDSSLTSFTSSAERHASGDSVTAETPAADSAATDSAAAETPADSAAIESSATDTADTPAADTPDGDNAATQPALDTKESRTKRKTRAGSQQATLPAADLKRSATDANLDTAPAPSKKQKNNGRLNSKAGVAAADKKRKAEEDAEADRELQTKKQKLGETLVRDFQIEESNVRGAKNAPQDDAESSGSGLSAPSSRPITPTLLQPTSSKTGRKGAKTKQS